MISESLSKLGHRLFIGTYPAGTSSTVIRLSSVLRTFSFIGVVPMFLFGVVNVLGAQPGTGFVEVGIGLLLLLNLAFLRRSLNYVVAGNVLLGLLLLVLAILLITGGLDRTGIYWFFCFPIVAYFIKGKHEGTLWILGLAAMILLGHILFQTNYLLISYTATEIRQLLAGLLVLSLLVYAYYQHIHKQDSEVLVRRERELLQQNQDLQAKVTQQSAAQQQQRVLIDTIDKTISDVQTKNVDLENAKLAMLNVLEDLEVERRRTEENERKDEAILASIGEGMIATDAGNKIIVANRQAAELLGYTTKELIGADYFDRVTPMNPEGVAVADKDRPFRQALKTGQSVTTTQYQYQRKDKSLFPVAITASPIQIGAKQIGGIMIFRDITKEKQIDKAKTEFVSLASHQLRTPLSAIGWYVEMLLSGDAGPLAKEQLDYLKEIQHGSKRLVDMVNSLLNVSRIELGTFMVEPKPTKPIEIADAVLGEVKALIEQKQLQLVKKFDKDIPVMNLDPHLLEIVLQNLVSNAVKYTPDKGTITVTLKHVDDALHIQVVDTGIGIPKEQMGRIFEKLFRADNVRATDTDGTGLGLYMVKQILEEVGGSVKLESVLNKGTTITVELPAAGMKPREGSRRLS